MKKLLYVLTGLILMAGLFTNCEKQNENSTVPKDNYTETAFGMNLEMVYVEGGTFEMGSTAEQGDDDILDEDEEYHPVRTIKLDGFHIGKYEVTQAQWKAVMGTSLEEQRALSDYDWGIVGEGSDYPMYYVSWEDAQAFCKNLSEQTGKKYVLPTEAMWEYAARGGVHKTKTMYAGSNDLKEVAWFRENSYGLGEEHPDYGTHRVGTKKANALGIYDMSGNVDECCSDWYGSYDENDTDNPQGPVNGSSRVERGGGWFRWAMDGRVSSRSDVGPDRRYYFLGFRVACSL